MDNLRVFSVFRFTPWQGFTSLARSFIIPPVLSIYPITYGVPYVFQFELPWLVWILFAPRMTHTFPPYGDGKANDEK